MCTCVPRRILIKKLNGRKKRRVSCRLKRIKRYIIKLRKAQRMLTPGITMRSLTSRTIERRKSCPTCIAWYYSQLTWRGVIKNLQTCDYLKSIGPNGEGLDKVQTLRLVAK